MNRSRYMILAAGVAVVHLLTGCGGMPRADEFAASMPEDVPVAEASNGAIFQSGRDIALFENAVARRVGDTVTVAKRLSTGNLVVRGQKWIGINQGKEYIRIQGVIRPVDILPDNSIPSYKVADANISYGGQGALADANRPGLLSRFFNSRWNPL